jgi:hypothetical protein
MVGKGKGKGKVVTGLNVVEACSWMGMSSCRAER